MKQYDTDQTSGEGGIGIRNVKERLLSFSPESTMEIESSIGNGTITRIRLKKTPEVAQP